MVLKQAGLHTCAWDKPSVGPEADLGLSENWYKLSLSKRAPRYAADTGQTGATGVTERRALRAGATQEASQESEGQE